MKTLKELVESLRSRKGKATGIDTDGAYWTPIDQLIRSCGGDGIGNSGPRIRYFLEVRHYRSGEVKSYVYREMRHQNYNDIISYEGLNLILTDTTVEDVIVRLKSFPGFSSDEYYGDTTEQIYEDYFEGSLSEALVKIGLPLREPSPDEDQIQK